MLTPMLAAVAAQLASPACPIERQVYRLQSDARFTAGFAMLDPRLPYASKLAFWLRTPRRTYWFSFHAPNGYGGTYIMPDLDPEAAARTLLPDAPEPGERGGEPPPTIEFDAFDAALAAYRQPPQAGDPAPARLFARGLGPALWYDPAGLAGGDTKAEPESMPVGMFEPAGCATGGR